MKRILHFVLGALFASAATTFCAPSPEQYAAATATLMRANALATTDALNYETQATRARMETHATATAIPLALGVNATTASRDSARVWGELLGGALLVCVLIALGLALVRWVQTRARIIPRDESGQLPAFWDAATGTLADPSRMIGPAITLPRQPDALMHLARIVHYLTSGQAQPLEQGRVETTDGGAGADHLLAAARAALATTATAAMFRPDNAERGRESKLKIIGGIGALGIGARESAPAPQTRVIVAGDSVIRAIAEQLGDRIPAVIDGVASSAPMVNDDDKA